MKNLRNIPSIFNEDFSPGDWAGNRRQEILRLFEEVEFGSMPDSGYRVKYSEESKKSVLSGEATCFQINMEFCVDYDTYIVPFTLVIPQKAQKCPVNLFIYPYENDAPGYPMERIDLQNEFKNPYWPAEMMINRGCGAAAFYVKDVESDNAESFPSGLIKFFESHSKTRGNSGRCIAAWAFAARHIVSYLVELSVIDSNQITIAGHSRGGKTALWCGATDERVSGIFSNCSGCGGASLARGTHGERIGQITKAFPHWFCETYGTYANRENELPFDQHMLLGLCAPRLLYVTSGSEDKWNDPEGEFLSCVYAGEIWKQYGLKGIKTTNFPEPGIRLHQGQIGYHVRKGGHDLTLFDWEGFFDFLTSQSLVHR